MHCWEGNGRKRRKQSFFWHMKGGPHLWQHDLVEGAQFSWNLILKLHSKIRIYLRHTKAGYDMAICRQWLQQQWVSTASTTNILWARMQLSKLEVVLGCWACPLLVERGAAFASQEALRTRSHPKKLVICPTAPTQNSLKAVYSTPVTIHINLRTPTQVRRICECWIWCLVSALIFFAHFFFSTTFIDVGISTLPPPTWSISGFHHISSMAYPYPSQTLAAMGYVFFSSEDCECFMTFVTMFGWVSEKCDRTWLIFMKIQRSFIKL